MSKHAPIEMSTRSILTGATAELKTFTSYDFDRNMLVPASAFRFTAGGVDKTERTRIRSGDWAWLYAENAKGSRFKLATGIIDETDTHIVPTSIEYVLTGRDTIGQLVDNAAVDASNKIIHIDQATLAQVTQILIKNTRLPAKFVDQDAPNGKLLYNTNPGETKINSLQRLLDYTNCLIWSNASGQAVIGRPDMAQDPMGSLTINKADPGTTNVLEMRVRRNLNQAIRSIVTQIQSLEKTDPTPSTILNNERDMLAVRGGLVGRSVFNLYSPGNGHDLINEITFIGNQSANPYDIGSAKSLRELARDNMKVLDVEAVVEGHMNGLGMPYNVDQVYTVRCEDEDLNEPMYVYGCRYALTMDRGAITTLKLCRLGTICAYVKQLKRAAA
jgi:prophage tail gpP-like protein